MKHPRSILLTIHHAQVMRHVFAALILAIASQDTVADPAEGMIQVEVFTTTDWGAVTEYTIKTKELHWDYDLQLYPLNGIQIIETELSKDLPADPDQSKYIALQRIQILEDKTRTRMQHSAIGLAMAMQYGVERLPAIVFDGQVVVYGVTDLRAALAHYEAWRKVAKP